MPGKQVIKSKTTLGLVAYLKDHPEGGHFEKLAPAAGVDGNTAAKVLDKMRKTGLVGSIKEPTDNLPRRNRYFLEEFREQAMMAHRAEEGVTWGRGVRSSAQRQVPTKTVARKPSVFTLVPSRWAVQSLPREKFFSDKRYRTDRIGQDTWAAKVYGY